jgi:hypothetical protein
MCRMDTRFFYLSFASLMALAFAGTYVLGENSWMSYLLFIPALLLFLGLRGLAVGEQRDAKAGAPLKPSSHDVRVGRTVRIGLALVGLSIPAAVLITFLGLEDLTMWIVAIPTMVLVSLVDREYFGWADSDDRSTVT